MPHRTWATKAAEAAVVADCVTTNGPKSQREFSILIEPLQRESVPVEFSGGHVIVAPWAFHRVIRPTGQRYSSAAGLMASLHTQSSRTATSVGVSDQFGLRPIWSPLYGLMHSIYLFRSIPDRWGFLYNAPERYSGVNYWLTPYDFR
jgi:hypothetical protein